LGPIAAKIEKIYVMQKPENSFLEATSPKPAKLKLEKTAETVYPCGKSAL
jgi:hypothetical protein